ncbi:calmodulin-A isoform X7 [Hydra vulgaris]|uniref:Calmodulin-A isoform X7 n=1 Tax=Hydra vulgaris TaxID=6087 RepID=A0ABM4CNK9_HYDVU
MAYSVTVSRRNHLRKRKIADNLSSEQLKEYQDAFQMFDKDGNGFITTRELKSLMRSLGCNPTDSELQQIVNEVDADGNGKIDFPEFICLMEKMTKPMEEQASTLEAYRVFDDDGAGFINSKCLRESLIRSLDQLSPSEINDLLDFSGLVQDRQINYEEFVRLVIPNSLLNLSSGGCKINLLEMSSRLNSPSFSKEEKDDHK